MDNVVDNVTPMRDLMVVEREVLKMVSSGGIYLPGKALEGNTARGKVIARGDGSTSDKTGVTTEIDVQVGDTVLFHAGIGIKLSAPKVQPERWLLREEDILAIVVED